MEKLKPYIVTKASSDGSIVKGDIIWISENGDLSFMGKGWLSKNEWNNPKTNDFKVKLCDTYYLETSNRREQLKKIMIQAIKHWRKQK